MKLDDFEKVFESRKPVPLGTYRYYAVMVPLVKKGDELFLLFEVRAEGLKRQPHEVCFPGGRREEDETMKECAIRETCEELQITPEQIRCIGQLDYLHTYSNFTLYPFLGVMDYETAMSLQVSQDEVKEIFLVPLKFFMENKPVTYQFDVLPQVSDDFPYEMINAEGGYNWRKGRSTVLIYRYDCYAIWGMTAMIVYHLINVMREELGCSD